MMADNSKSLIEEVKRLEKLFTVLTKDLKRITEHFVNELKRGLSVEGGNIVRSLVYGRILSGRPT